MGTVYSEEGTSKVQKALPGLREQHVELPRQPSSPGRQLLPGKARPLRICLILYKEGGLCLSLPPC